MASVHSNTLLTVGVSIVVITAAAGVSNSGGDLLCGIGSQIREPHIASTYVLNKSCGLCVPPVLADAVCTSEEEAEALRTLQAADLDELDGSDSLDGSDASGTSSQTRLLEDAQDTTDVSVIDDIVYVIDPPAGGGVL